MEQLRGQLSGNVADFDILQQLLPSTRIMLYRRKPAELRTS
jgi:hypothetical protein